MKINTRKHLERSQPAARLKYGLLEKHKDYKLRARDYAVKRERLKILKEKARFRNEDEFYHAMINSYTKQGVHMAARNENFDQETIQLLKSQDLKYVAYHVDINRKQIAIIKSKLKELGLSLSTDAEKTSTENHTRFAESTEEAEEMQVQIAADSEIDSMAKDESMIRKFLRNLAARMKRDESISRAEAELQTQKNMNAKGRRYKVGTDSQGNDIYKWRAERSK
eukprot:Partr_v1_DN28764_c2_g1_i2_m62892 putative U3 small nucleolar RNA-associated protein